MNFFDAPEGGTLVIPKLVRVPSAAMAIKITPIQPNRSFHAS